MKKGFTLIELLIVIVIVVILTLIIIFYFFSTRDKTQDALIKETMSTQLSKLSIEYYVSSAGGYAAFCNNALTVELLNKINSPSAPECHSDKSRWVVCAQLNYSSAKAWCADNTGVKKEIDNNDCDNNIHSCP